MSADLIMAAMLTLMALVMLTGAEWGWAIALGLAALACVAEHIRVQRRIRRIEQQGPPR